MTPTTSEQTAVVSGVYTTGAVKVGAISTETKSITSNGTYTPTDGKYFSSVTVNVPSSGGATLSLQSKTITPTTSKQTITADNGYDGLSSVTVNAIQTETKSITDNGTYTPTSGKYFSSVNVNVPYQTYRTGSGAPSNSLGSDGDLYFDMGWFIIATLILRPSSDISLNHKCSSGETGYNLINDEISDGDSSYISKSVTGIVKVTSIFGLTPVSLSNIKINSAKVVVVGKKTSNLKTSAVLNASLIQNDTTLISAGTSHLSTEYVAYEASTNSLSSLDNLTLEIVSEVVAGISASRQTRITQAYVEIDYDEISSGTNFYIKNNGSYAEVQKVYKKVNGVYVEQTDISSLFSTSTKYKKGNWKEASKCKKKLLKI